MPATYKIISEGCPGEGQNKEDVIERLSRLFKMDLEKAAKLVSGKAVVLKSSLDHAAMRKYRQALTSTGLKFKIEPSPSKAGEKTSDPAAGRFACPKCGHENAGRMDAPDASCSQCGVLFQKMAAKHKRPNRPVQTNTDNTPPGVKSPNNPSHTAAGTIKELFDDLPKSIRIFWYLMGVVYVIALLRAVTVGGVGFFIGVAIGGVFVWFLLPYYCMREKGFWAWLFTVVWTFPFGLGLLSESAKTYFQANDR